MDANVLYWGDNLPILRNKDYFPDQSVDLIYLDPPFNSNASYNVLFKEATGAPSTAQAEAFKDTWHWADAQDTWADLHNTAPKRVVDALEAFQKIIVLQEGRFAHNDMMAYLVMMTARLLELHRILKPIGSLYLHCDPTASHYLKIMLDTIFGPTSFRNEIVWKRTSAHSDTKQGMRRYGRIRDVILFYTKSLEYKWHPQYLTYDAKYLQQEYRHVDFQGQAYKETDLTAAKPGGDTEYEWHVKRAVGKGIRWEADLDEEYKNPMPGFSYKVVRPYKGRFWAYSKDNLAKFAKEGRLIHRETGMPRLIQIADEMQGVPLQDSWDDIPPVLGKEDSGYATQKPLALLERIIQASSNEGDIVLDPFCGCGTAVLAAHKLNRRWIGIDVTILAVNVMKQRLQEAFPDLKGKYRVVGEPTTLSEAKALAAMEPALEMRYQFQYWALGLVGARPASDSRKKGADAGVDGFFSVEHTNDGKKVTYKQVIVQVKSGHVTRSHISELAGVIGDDRLGVFITLEDPTEPMKAAALAAGLYHNPRTNKHYPRVQIMTIAELLDGKSPNLPPHRPGWERGSYIGQRIQQGTLIQP